MMILPKLFPKIDVYLGNTMRRIAEGFLNLVLVCSGLEVKRETASLTTAQLSDSGSVVVLEMVGHKFSLRSVISVCQRFAPIKDIWKLNLGV